MGLDIVRYHACYSTLHKFRQLALKYNGIDCDIFNFYKSDIPTKFEAFIHHSDCDGYYVSKDYENFEQYKEEYENNPVMCGDLDKLKEEVQELNNYISNNCGLYKGTWNNFYLDVMEAEGILKFH